MSGDLDRYKESLNEQVDGGGCTEAWAAAQAQRKAPDGDGETTGRETDVTSSTINRRSVLKKATGVGVSATGLVHLSQSAAASTGLSLRTQEDLEEVFAKSTTDLREALVDRGFLSNDGLQQFSTNTPVPDGKPVGPGTQAEGIRISPTRAGGYQLSLSHNTDNYGMAIFTDLRSRDAHAVIETNDRHVVITGDGVMSDDFCWTTQDCVRCSCQDANGVVATINYEYVERQCCFNGLWFDCRKTFQGSCYGGRCESEERSFYEC